MGKLIEPASSPLNEGIIEQIHDAIRNDTPLSLLIMAHYDDILDLYLAEDDIFLDYILKFENVKCLISYLSYHQGDKRLSSITYKLINSKVSYVRESILRRIELLEAFFSLLNETTLSKQWIDIFDSHFSKYEAYKELFNTEIEDPSGEIYPCGGYYIILMIKNHLSNQEIVEFIIDVIESNEKNNESWYQNRSKSIYDAIHDKIKTLVKSEEEKRIEISMNAMNDKNETSKDKSYKDKSYKDDNDTFKGDKAYMKSDIVYDSCNTHKNDLNVHDNDLNGHDNDLNGHNVLNGHDNDLNYCDMNTYDHTLNSNTLSNASLLSNLSTLSTSSMDILSMSTYSLDDSSSSIYDSVINPTPFYVDLGNDVDGFFHFLKEICHSDHHGGLLNYFYSETFIDTLIHAIFRYRPLYIATQLLDIFSLLVEKVFNSRNEYETQEMPYILLKMLKGITPNGLNHIKENPMDENGKLLLDNNSHVMDNPQDTNAHHEHGSNEYQKRDALDSRKEGCNTKESCNGMDTIKSYQLNNSPLSVLNVYLSSPTLQFSPSTLGLFRLNLIKLVDILIMSNYGLVLLSILSLDIVSTIFSLMLEFENNNILHCYVTDIISNILYCDNTEYIIYWFKMTSFPENLLSMILTLSVENNDLRIPHYIAMIQRVEESDDQIQNYIDNIPNWKRYYDEYVKP